MIKKETQSQNTEREKLLNKINCLEKKIAALQNTEKLFKETQQDLKNRNESLVAINTLADRIYRSFDYKTLAREAISAMIQYGKTPTVSMFEYDEAEKCLVMIDYSKSISGKESVNLTRKLYLDKSIAGRAVLEKRIILCPDIAADPYILPATKEALLKEGRRSVVCIPLLFRNRVLGVMNLLFAQKYTFADYELETLLSIGKTIGLAIANTRNIEKIKSEIEQRKKAQEAMVQSIASLKTVNAVADQVYRSLDYDTVIHEAIAAMVHYGHTPTIVLFEYREDLNCLVFLDSSEKIKHAESIRLIQKLHVGESLAGDAFLKKAIIICNDIATDQRISPEVRATLAQEGERSAVSVPLLFQDRAYGVMNLVFPEKIIFTDSELETLMSIGKTIGLAMANTRHIQQIKTEVEERKKAQEALRQSEEKYRLLIENAGDAIFIGREGFVTYANPRALELLEYSPEELAEKPITSFLIGETEQGKKQKAEIKTAYDIKKFQLINKRKQKLSLEVHTVDIIWESQGASLYFARDVTGREQMEAQLYQAQRMEAVGTLAGGLAHDFNNLLMGIGGNISLMLMQTPDRHPYYDRLKNIEHYVASGAEITAQLLGFARGGKYEVKPIDINKLIGKSASMFGNTKKEISIHENFGKNIWSVEADHGQIEQVLLNLFVNAWQALPGGGNIYLLTANKEMDENMAAIHGIKPGRYVKISVTDDGMGMDQETKRRIFDPFFTTRERSRGMGLGLPSAYGIVKNHGGVITVYSIKGQGATFNVYLPASARETAMEDKASEVYPQPGKETILFIDDEAMIIDVGKDMLESMGYKVFTAGSGKKALEIYAENNSVIDLVVLDLIMPGLGGEATFEKLREINPAVKVLLSSGYSINGLATKLLNLGCRGFIQKPYSIKEFSAKIRETLDLI